MLNPRSNRLNYGEILSPPEGYTLVKAVGTTYSLDLYALLAIPVAMFYAKSMEGDFIQNRYDVLDAIRQSKEKVDIFCQKGKIKVPQKYNNLLAFVEACVQEVTPPICNSSFHPKIWVMRFEKEKEVIYRLVVLSRNLTFDRSWDVAFHSDGKLGGINSESKKLSNYLSYFYKSTKRDVPIEFLKGLSKVEFDCPENFFDFTIYPILGFENKINKFPNPIVDKEYDELLVISPFVDDITLGTLLKKNKKLSLFSREEELNKLKIETIDAIKLENIFCINSVIVEGESIIDTENTEPLLQNLHAKLFIGQKGKIADWYMGSANCTSPANGRNAEILVGMNTKDKQASVSEISNILSDENNKFFTPYVRQEIEDNKEEVSLEAQVRDFCYQLILAPIIGEFKKKDVGDNYDLIIELELKNLTNDIFNVEASLIHDRSKKHALKLDDYNEIKFENIAITNSSQFIVLSVFHDKELKQDLLVKVDINIPEEREDTIFNSLINSKLKFFQYLQFILSPDQFSGVLGIIQEPSDSDKSTNNDIQNLLGTGNAIYESLMLAASRSPQKLKEIDAIVTRLQKLDSEVLADFLPIWNVFKEFAHA